MLGTAVKAAEAAMLWYGATVRPLAFEMFGRLGRNSMATLRDSAGFASVASLGRTVRETALVRCWRFALDATLLHEKADLLVQSLGCHACRLTQE